MGTAASVKEVSGKGEATGVIPRCIKSIFATIQSVRADYDVNMKVCLLPLLTLQLAAAIVPENCALTSPSSLCGCIGMHQTTNTRLHAIDGSQSLAAHAQCHYLSMPTPHMLHPVQVDFVEVYQDQVRDLLINPNEDGTTRMPAIDVRESPTQGVFLEGVRSVAIALLMVKLVSMQLQLSSEEQTKIPLLAFAVTSHPLLASSVKTSFDCSCFIFDSALTVRGTVTSEIVRMSSAWKIFVQSLTAASLQQCTTCDKPCQNKLPWWPQGSGGKDRDRHCPAAGGREWTQGCCCPQPE